MYYRFFRQFLPVLFVVFLSLLVSVGNVGAVEKDGIFFSTEEEFVTQGPEPADGNPIISDGDLLVADGSIYMRNRKLLGPFDVEDDLGLDAIAVLDPKEGVVGFSTELDSPHGSFTAGDLLFTNGAIVPNRALLALFKVPRQLDLGLDGVYFRGKKENILEFINIVRERGRKYWLEQPAVLSDHLKEMGIDIWFSVEGTMSSRTRPIFLDGDLLSAASGTIVLRNSDALPGAVPAGIPVRGVDFGMDSVTMLEERQERATNRYGLVLFSPEINGLKLTPSFTDGDALLRGNGVMFNNIHLIGAFEPKTRDLGLDALSVIRPSTRECRFTKIGGMPVTPGLWDSMTGYVDYEGSGRKNYTFGRWVSIRGELGPDSVHHRVLYRPEGGSDSPILIPAADGWRVYDHDLSTWTPVSIVGDGWLSTSFWRYLKEAGNGDLILVNWQTSSLEDGKYVLTLQTRDASGKITTCEERAVQIDNTKPKLSLEPATECQVYDQSDLPIEIEGEISDDHFSHYELRLDSYWIHPYHSVTTNHYYDGHPLDDKGTVPPPPQLLGKVDIPPSLWGEDKEGGRYTVSLYGWDRSILGRFKHEFNIVMDGWWRNRNHVITNFEFYP
jgi:hypothetical protein